MSIEEWEARDRALADVHETLVATGVLVPLLPGGDEGRRWVRCELALYAENRLGEVADPMELDRSTRERWAATALDGTLPRPTERTFQSCYWILRGGEIAGTLALSRFCLGWGVRAHSVYVRPAYRGAGMMAETLRAVREALDERGLGLVLETPWTWQRAVRFYLRNGFWLRSWKRDLTFISIPHMPPPTIEVGAREATLSVESDGGAVVLIGARREGRSLVWPDDEIPPADDSCRAEVAARTTLSLAAAVAGWPLIRSDGHWERYRWTDLVHPEGLASRIQEWEAWTDERGWRVETPRIPGLAYPAWSELENAN